MEMQLEMKQLCADLSMTTNLLEEERSIRVLTHTHLLEHQAAARQQAALIATLQTAVAQRNDRITVLETHLRAALAGTVSSALVAHSGGGRVAAGRRQLAIAARTQPRTQSGDGRDG